MNKFKLKQIDFVPSDSILGKLRIFLKKWAATFAFT